MKIQRILTCLLFVLLIGCATQHRPDTITQVSTLDVLLARKWNIPEPPEIFTLNLPCYSFYPVAAFRLKLNL